MLEVGPFAAPVHDVLRLIAVPAFAWAAWSDIETRRITNNLWPPLVAVAIVALLFEGVEAYTVGGITWQQFTTFTVLSIAILFPLAIGFWYFGGFGGADAKALMVIALLFPTYPTYIVAGNVLPMVIPDAGLFPLAILTNAVLLGIAYPLGLAGYNALHGRFALRMFVGRPISPAEAERLPGRLLESAAGFDRSGLDLDALRMYLRWRGCTLADLRDDPEHFRETLPADPGEPGDGVVTDGGEVDDPWGAEAFLDAIEGDAYGTPPEKLRGGLTLLTTREEVWYSPGIPFVLLLAIGLFVALVYGDVFLTLITLVGFG